MTGQPTDERSCRPASPYLASDGRLSPTELVRLVARQGLKTISITDHDTTDGLEEAFEAAREFPGLRIIPGIELRRTSPATRCMFSATSSTPTTPSCSLNCSASAQAGLTRQDDGGKAGRTGHPCGMGEGAAFRRRRRCWAPSHSHGPGRGRVLRRAEGRLS